MLVGAAIRSQVHCDCKGVDVVSSRWWNDAQLVLRGPKCDQEKSPTQLHHYYQPELLMQGRMDPSFHVYAQFWPYQLNVAAKIETQNPGNIFPVLFSFCEAVQTVDLCLSWQEWHLMCSVNPRDSVGKLQQISSLWNAQTSLCGTNNHVTFKVTWVYVKM